MNCLWRRRHRVIRAIASREERMTQLLADGTALNVAGELMGLSKGQTARVWMNIKKRLGTQAI